MHKNFEINRTSGFLLINFLNVGLLRFGLEKFACLFLCAVVSGRRNGPIDLIFFLFITSLYEDDADLFFMVLLYL